jgi:hypothetical protein
MQMISVPTNFGTLVAQVGMDDTFPEILVYLRNENGNELMLAAVTDNTVLGAENDCYGLRIAVYGDPSYEDYTDYFTIGRSDLEADSAMWI